jgi:hypothetical protein
MSNLEYKIVYSQSPEDFVAQVNKAMQDGWGLYGNTLRDSWNGFFIQPLIKEHAGHDECHYMFYDTTLVNGRSAGWTRCSKEEFLEHNKRNRSTYSSK